MPQPVRMVTKIVVTYRTPTGATEELTIAHAGPGEEIDGIVLSQDLMTKLAYLENGRCREPEKRPGQGDWRVRGRRSGGSGGNGGSMEGESTSDDGAALMSLGDATAAGGGNCIWLHDNGCSWLQYCDT